MANNSSTNNGSKSASQFNVFSGIKYQHLIAGMSGGVASTLILHPLDLMKIRFAGEFLILLIKVICVKVTMC